VREREGEIPVLMIVGPKRQKLHELGTLCPEYPGLRPEYPDRVLQWAREECQLPRGGNVRFLKISFHKSRLSGNSHTRVKLKKNSTKQICLKTHANNTTVFS